MGKQYVQEHTYAFGAGFCPMQISLPRYNGPRLYLPLQITFPFAQLVRPVFAGRLLLAPGLALQGRISIKAEVSVFTRGRTHMTSAKFSDFRSPSSCCKHLATDLHYQIHATSVT